MSVDVLPSGYVRNSCPVDVCPCQYGPSGHCGEGRHERCPRTLGSDRHGIPLPETHVVSRSWGALTPVWRVGAACRWLCPCECHSTVQALFPAPKQSPPRASRRGGNNRIWATDNLRRYDPAHPTLWED